MEKHSLFLSRPYWASRFGIAPVLPMSVEEMAQLGWDSCDIILVTGDAYVDHPSFGMAVIGRLLEAHGFRVGIISQPDWQNVKSFRVLGRPNLFFGVTAGNMDSMVNRYTSDCKIRSDDAYTPGGLSGKRPDRAVIVYSQRCREAYPKVPVVIGGIESSLRRVAHFDYWSEKIRRSILLDAKADILLYGNAERAVVELAYRMASGEAVQSISDLRGTVLALSEIPEGWTEVDRSRMEPPAVKTSKLSPVEATPSSSGAPQPVRKENTDQKIYVRLPSYEQLVEDRALYAHASRHLHLESNPGNARVLVQKHGQRELWINPPPLPLTMAEMDRVFALPYTRQPHPCYAGEKIPAYEMIRFSIIISRGCFGGCAFCSITEHEGRIIQNRSPESVVREIEIIRDTVPGFTGMISDLGGPTANMYRLHCQSSAIEAVCRRLSCLHPRICSNLNINHAPLIDLYRKARQVKGVKKITIGSGVRYDLAVEAPEYIKELVTYHVGGYLKIAPEHTESGPLDKMMKPGIAAYTRFKELFDKYSLQAGKEQYLIPYFIAAHPGTTDEDMLRLAVWLKQNGLRADQVQSFLPTPMSLATAMYYSSKNPLHLVHRESEEVYIPKGLKQRRLQKAFLRYHDAHNWPLLRETLIRLGREDLIGNGKKHLIPLYQPKGTEGRNRAYGKRRG
ncbi:YgiQ family radical SAM protein [Deltaproteobacteria bacterium TL4]